MPQSYGKAKGENPRKIPRHKPELFARAVFDMEKLFNQIFKTAQTMVLEKKFLLAK
jgi:hypothetical protein